LQFRDYVILRATPADTDGSLCKAPTPPPFSTISRRTSPRTSWMQPARQSNDREPDRSTGTGRDRPSDLADAPAGRLCESAWDHRSWPARRIGHPNNVRCM